MGILSRPLSTAYSGASLQDPTQMCKLPPSIKPAVSKLFGTRDLFMEDTFFMGGGEG